MSQDLELAAIQAAIQQQGAKWQAGETSISALSQAERRFRLGAVPPQGKPTLAEREQAALAKYAQAVVPEAPALPRSFDWRSVNGKNYVTSVKDQGNCGSCVAFGSTATVEAMFQIQRSNPSMGVDLSEAQLFYCVAASEGRNCQNGWWIDHALDAYKNQGIADEACFPYKAGNQSCKVCSDWQDRAIKITGWHSMTSVSDMKTWLSAHGPLGTCFTVYQDFYYYKGGVYTRTSNVVVGGHCVCVVGYDDNAGCWICKNSWGTGWGEHGFFRIAYGQCGIDAEMWAVEGILETMWFKNVYISGLWAIDQNFNAYAGINGVGWRKIASNTDNIFYDMLSQVILAKAAGRPCNIYENQGIITQIYVL